MNKKITLRNTISFTEILIFIFFLLLTSLLILFYFKGLSSSFTYKGINLIQKKKFFQAHQQFKQALEKKPFEPWIYLNLAFNYDLMNEYNKSMKNYDIVSSYFSKIPNKSVFFSYFNKGELQGRQKNLKLALKNYQQALSFDYEEDKVKTNIELLFKNTASQNKNKEKKQSSNEEDKNSEHIQKKRNSSYKTTDKKPESKNQKKRETKKLTENEQKSILKEIEKQENKAHINFYQKKHRFGDKAQKDW